VKTDMSPRDSMKNEAGMTLIEVMIAVVITLVIIAAAFSMLILSQKTTIVTGQVADTQQNVRLAMELLARDVRLASYNYIGNAPGAPTVGTCSILNGAVPTPVGIRPNDKTPAGADNGPDGISMVVPVLADSATPWVLSANVGGTGPDPVPFNLLPMSAAAITDMASQGLAVGSVVSIGGAGAKAVTSVGGTNIQLASNFNGKFPVGTTVYLLQCVTYAISTNPVVCGAGSSTCLTRNGVAFVDGIEDIQFAYGCDGCSTVAPNPLEKDGVVDETDGVNPAAGPSANDFVTNSAWNLSPMTPDKIKQVQIIIVARQVTPDPGFGDQNIPGVNTNGPVVVSDHNPSADPGYNATTYAQQRRRVLTRVIQPRNM
jgi:type IV pilus assembly protein PilW